MKAVYRTRKKRRAAQHTLAVNDGVISTANAGFTNAERPQHAERVDRDANRRITRRATESRFAVEKRRQPLPARVRSTWVLHEQGASPVEAGR